MSDEMELLRTFRADVETPDEETRRRIHDYVTQVDQPRDRLSGRRYRPARFQISAAPNPRTRRRIVGVLALALAAAAVAVATTRVGASTPKGAQAVANGVDGVVSQVQASFGDGRILSASVEGSTLSVKLVAPDGPSLASATFEAQVLAHAVRDWMSSNGQAPIDSVIYLDANGTPLQDSPQGGDPVANDPTVAPVTGTACDSAAQAAQAAQASLSIVSARALPFLGGACVFAFQTSDPSSFASDAPITIGKLVNTLGDPNERPYLVEVDDQSGIPQFVASYVPGEGGQAYVKPGLSRVFFGSPPVAIPPTG